MKLPTETLAIIFCDYEVDSKTQNRNINLVLQNTMSPSSHTKLLNGLQRDSYNIPAEMAQFPRVYIAGPLGLLSDLQLL
jgi:hypothetical protein